MGVDECGVVGPEFRAVVGEGEGVEDFDGFLGGHDGRDTVSRDRSCFSEVGLLICECLRVTGDQGQQRVG